MAIKSKRELQEYAKDMNMFAGKDWFEKNYHYIQDDNGNILARNETYFRVDDYGNIIEEIEQ